MKITVWCPVCNGVQEHEILKKGKESLVRCTGCGYTHRIREEKMQGFLVKTIVSTGEASRVCFTELDRSGTYRLGDSVIADCGEEEESVEITGIELENRRVERAKGQDIQTLWTRAIQEVIVKISLHEGRSTTPLYLRIGGDGVFVVDQDYVVEGRRFRISHIKLRNDRFLRRAGESTAAKAIKRIYGFRS
ncbi:MAG: hypothetical protein LUP99_03345 [Methanomicrobiales archaeon]|nr:hypothetical protein [Methanomicrobiales archaeon]